LEKPAGPHHRDSFSGLLKAVNIFSGGTGIALVVLNELIKYFRNYLALNLIIKIPLQKALPPFIQKGDLGLSKKHLFQNTLSNYVFLIFKN
jgi:hypothetical protein